MRQGRDTQARRPPSAPAWPPCAGVARGRKRGAGRWAGLVPPAERVGGCLAGVGWGRPGVLCGGHSLLPPGAPLPRFLASPGGWWEPRAPAGLRPRGLRLGRPAVRALRAEPPPSLPRHPLPFVCITPLLPPFSFLSLSPPRVTAVCLPCSSEFTGWFGRLRKIIILFTSEVFNYFWVCQLKWNHYFVPSSSSGF